MYRNAEHKHIFCVTCTLCCRMPLLPQHFSRCLWSTPEMPWPVSRIIAYWRGKDVCSVGGCLLGSDWTCLEKITLYQVTLRQVGKLGEVWLTRKSKLRLIVNFWGKKIMLGMQVPLGGVRNALQGLVTSKCYITESYSYSMEACLSAQLTLSWYNGSIWFDVC